MFEMRSIPELTTRKGILAITSCVLKGSVGVAFLLLFLLAAVSRASATTTVTLNYIALTSASTTGVTTAPFGTSVTFNATVSPATAGTITFKNGSTAITTSTCTTTVSVGTCTATSTTVPAGSDSITANFSSTASSPETFVVTSVALAVGTTAVPGTSITTEPYGTSVRLTATPTPAGSTWPSNSTVTFYNGSTPLCSAVAVGATTTICDTTALPVATANSLTAVVTSGSTSTYATSPASTAVSLAITPVVTLTSANPAGGSGSGARGATVTLSAAVSPTTLGGTVKFYNGTSNATQLSCSTGALAGQSLTSGVATCGITVPTGSTAMANIYALYTPTSGPTGNATMPFTITTGTTTTTTDGSMATTAVYGSSYTLKGDVALSPAAVAAVPAAAINFYASTTSSVLGTLVGTCNTAVIAISGTSGTCTTTTTTLPPGNTVYVTAVYAGGTVYESSSSAQLSVAVSDPTTTTLTAASTSTYGTSYTMAAAVTTPAGGGTPPAALVTFWANGTGTGTNVGTCTTSGGSCSTTTTTLPPGSPTVLTASYAGITSGGVTYSSSPSTGTNVTASKAALGVALTYSTAATVAQGTSVILTATVTPTTVAYGTVNFQSNGTTIGVCGAVQTGSGSASCTTTALAAGTDALTAVFTQTTNTTDFSNFGSVPNGTNSIQVNATPILSVTPTVASLPVASTFYYGASVSLNVSGFNSAAVGNSVSFVADGTTTIATCTLSSGGTCTAAQTYSGLSVLSHSIQAIYAGGGAPAANTPAVTVNVIANPTLVALAPSTASVYLTSGTVPLTATVTTADGVAIPSGHVTFYDSTTPLGAAVSVSGGVATYTIPAATLTTPGTHYIIASYSGVYSAVGTATFGASLSHSSQVVVDNTQTISHFYNGSTVFGTPITLSAVSSSASDSTNGNPVSYTLTSVAPAAGSTLTLGGTTLIGSTLTPNGVGTVTVTANIASNSYYTAATPVVATFKVYPAPLNITASSPGTLSYGSAAPTITATYAPYSGTSATPPTALTTAPTCTSAYTGAVTNHPGTYTTYCYGAVSANYDITYTNGSTGLVITKATPTFGTAPTASAITYGPVSTSTLTGGTATGPFGTAIAGHYVWASPTVAPAAGTPSADTPSVNFNPSDTTDYYTLTGAASITINVSMANPSVIWPAAFSVPAGTTTSNGPVSPVLSSSTSVALSGTFSWTTPTTIVKGANSLSVTYTPTNASYNTITHNITVTGTAPIPDTIVWPTAGAITYGQKLVNSVLSGGSASLSSTPVVGTFVWASPSFAPNANVGTGNGSQPTAFTMIFKPTDTADYSSVTNTYVNNSSGGVALEVDQAVPTVSSWPTIAPISYGQTLGALSNTTGFAFTCASTSCTSVNDGLVAGSNNVSVTYTPTNTNYGPLANPNVKEFVSQTTPTVSTWPTATPITAVQTEDNSTLSIIAGGVGVPPVLDQTTGVTTLTGTFTWSCAASPDTCSPPPVGTTGQSVTFTPTGTDGNGNTNSTDFTTVTQNVNLTVNACGHQDSVNNSYAAALSVYNFSNNGTTVTDPSLDVSSGTSTGVDVSAICAVTSTIADGTAITVQGPAITSEGNPSAGAQVGAPADYSAYGTNAAVLAYGLNTTAGAGATITIEDDGAGNAGSILTENDYTAGVAASEGGTVIISNTNVYTGVGGTGNYAPALMATKQGTLTISNWSSEGGAGNGPVYASTDGNHSPVLATGLGGGTVTSTANFYSSGVPSSLTEGLESAGVHAAGATGGTGSLITLSGDTITTQNASIVEVNGKSTVTINSTNTENAPATLTGTMGDAHGIFLYYDSTPGDAVVGTSAFSMTGGSLSYSCDATAYAAVCAPSSPTGYESSLPTLFAVANTTATIALTDVQVTNFTPTNANANGVLLTASAISGLCATGSNANEGTCSSPSAGATVTFTAKGETLAGDVIVDATSTVNLLLKADTSSVGTALTGTIDGGNVTGGKVNLTLDAASNWVVTGTSYVWSLTNSNSANTNITCYNQGCKVYQHDSGSWVAVPGVQ